MLYRHVVSMLILASYCMIVCAFDRTATIQYAFDYAFIYNTSSHNPPGPYFYYPYEPPVWTLGDCANFQTQCLIAGGIRYRTTSTLAQENLTSPSDKAEDGTNQNTKSLDSNYGTIDKGKFSRVISGATQARISHVNQRHHGTPTGAYKAEWKQGDFAGDQFWNLVQPGDIAYKLHHNDHSGHHSMIITEVDYTNRTFKVAAHTSDTSGTDVGTYVGSDWKTSCDFVVVIMPDAPRIDKPLCDSYVYPLGNRTSLSAVKLGWWKEGYYLTHANDNCATSMNVNQGMLIKITFDTPMKTTDTGVNTAFSVILGGTTYYVTPKTDGGFINGWWTGADDGINKRMHDRTFAGWLEFTGGQPPKKTTMLTLKISWYSDRGYGIDIDNDLAKYEWSAPFELIKVYVDGQGGSARR